MVASRSKANNKCKTVFDATVIDCNATCISLELPASLLCQICSNQRDKLTGITVGGHRKSTNFRNTLKKNRHEQRWTDEHIFIPNCPESRFRTYFQTCNCIGITPKVAMQQGVCIHKSSLTCTPILNPPKIDNRRETNVTKRMKLNCMLDDAKIETLKSDLDLSSCLACAASKEIEYEKSKNSLVYESKVTSKTINQNYLCTSNATKRMKSNSMLDCIKIKTLKSDLDWIYYLAELALLVKK